MRFIFVCCVAIVLLGSTVSKSEAISYPFDKTEMTNAITYGTSVTRDQLLSAPEWKVKCSSSPYGIDLTVFTPFFESAFAANVAKAKFDDPLKAANEFKDEKTVKFLILVRNASISANSDPAVVVKTTNGIIHADKVEVGRLNPDADYFHRSITATFAASKLPKQMPFTLAVGNIEDQNRTELDYIVDLSMIR
ncbi:MAG: hypothetical protein M3N13_01935 [Candidatus Eremiobacteraeota bacterium]|nr:hypothetical protein [Candidatus Eremiobacteraeota bacterium]